MSYLAVPKTRRFGDLLVQHHDTTQQTSGSVSKRASAGPILTWYQSQNQETAGSLLFMCTSVDYRNALLSDFWRRWLAIHIVQVTAFRANHDRTDEEAMVGPSLRGMDVLIHTGVRNR